MMFGSRWSIFAVAATMLLASLGTIPSPLTQTDQEERIAGLETQVARHDKRIDRLADSVATIASGDHERDDSAQSDEDEGSSAQGEAITLSGFGDSVTEPFRLDQGVAQFTASHDGQWNFIVHIYNQSGDEALVFNEIGPYQGTRVIQVGSPGTFYLAVQADGNWSFEITQ